MSLSEEIDVILINPATDHALKPSSKCPDWAKCL